MTDNELRAVRDFIVANPGRPVQVGDSVTVFQVNPAVPHLERLLAEVERLRDVEAERDRLEKLLDDADQEAWKALGRKPGPGLSWLDGLTELPAEVERLRAALRESAGRCSACRGSGFVLGRQNEPVPCADCAAARKALEGTP